MKYDLDRREFLSALAAMTVAEAFTLTSRAAEQVQAPPVSRHFEYGADYYVEDWPRERVEIDAKLMRQAGFRTVRLADTNWERMQPEESRYDFSWLDSAIEILNRYGIRAVLCTSSYVPPAWLVAKHPDFYLVNEAGVRHRWGGMGFMCLNHPLYRQYVEKLVTALATHFGQHPGVIGWQIDNEMGQWGAECYDEHFCQPKFQQYLQQKFGTLEELNRRLWTVSYGHSYSSWDQILLRSNVALDALQAPLVLESERFFSANIAEFIAFQAALLRQHTSGQFITHNGPALQRNCFEFARSLDFISEDNYPRVGESAWPAFTTDLMRGFNHGKSFQVLEARSGTYGAYTLGDATPPPGLARLWAWQTIAHGADGFLFFRWRMSNGGSEEYWQGILNYDGSPSIVYPEVVRLGEEFQRVGPELVGAETPADVAVIVSYDSLWALQIGDNKFPYFDQLQLFSKSFRQWSHNVDFVEAGADLSKYKVVAAPLLHVIDPGVAQNLEAFVSRGGVLLLGPRSGFKNEDNLATQVAPGPLARMARVRVRSFTLIGEAAPEHSMGFPDDSEVYRPKGENHIHSESVDWPGEYEAKGWADILEAEGAQTLFRYKTDYYAGNPAVTIAEFGQGKAIYIGALLEPRFYVDLARRACEWGKLEPGPKMAAGMDFALRRRNGRDLRFLLNFGNDAKTVSLKGEHRDLISGKTFRDQVTVPPLELCVLV